MNESKNNGYSGISSTSLLQIAFIVLKLIGKIEWSWIWVLAPSWISIILFLIAVIISYLADK